MRAKSICLYSIFFLFILFVRFTDLNSQVLVEHIGEHRLIVRLEGNYTAFRSLHSSHGEVDQYVQDTKTYISVSGLEPATLVKLCVEYPDHEKLKTEEIILMTASQSTGEIKVYFNNSVDTTFRKNNHKPDGTTFSEVQTALRNLIRNAVSSIDYAVYNTSEIFIVNELIDAFNRGVRVRIVTDDETSNNGWSAGVPFPIVKGNIGAGLMHNKFIIVDPHLQDGSWVVTGAMNFTSNQMRRDPNHLIFIQDQALAKAYMIEFEEMWGSDTAVPNLSQARFGSQKIKNTPTNFVINNIPVELYFSPTDQTTSQIAKTLEMVSEEQLLALMIFTNWELRDKVVFNANRNIGTRWIVDDSNNSSNVINAVRAAKGEVFVHTHPDIFHHKYAILDENTMNARLITGSHNWTFSAETVNDENTLIIYDAGLANIFRQEFEARWKELRSSSGSDITFEGNRIFPNPTHGRIYFQFPVIDAELFSFSGHLIKKWKGELNFLELDVPPGIYFIRSNDYYGKIVKI
jgi:phosphatidylserine/phosphatidylglycerophosphate/cardiolipin synthase-like enzyme